MQANSMMKAASLMYIRKLESKQPGLFQASHSVFLLSSVFTKERFSTMLGALLERKLFPSSND